MLVAALMLTMTLTAASPAVILFTSNVLLASVGGKAIHVMPQTSRPTTILYLDLSPRPSHDTGEPMFLQVLDEEAAELRCNEDSEVRVAMSLVSLSSSAALGEVPV